MELEKKKSLFEIRPSGPGARSKGGVFPKGRILLGRTESCDLIVNNDSVSAIHAVLEIFETHAKIYDMNSTNGTFVGGEKVIVKELRLGDTFSLGEAAFILKPYVAAAALPPVLDSLEPLKGSASIMVPSELPPATKLDPSRSLPRSAPVVSDRSAPSIVYPLASDPKAEFSEYIFEDKETLYPIFKYESAKQAVEVIILFKDQVFSVDYLPEGKATYYITGVLRSSRELEFPYLGKNEKFPFVDVGQGVATVHTLPGFDVFLLSDRKKDTGHVGAQVELAGQDLVRLQKGDLQIYVRNVQAPPKVASAPILKRDPEFRKYLLFCLLFVAIFSVGHSFLEVPEDEEKKEPTPERVATILYKQPLTVSKNPSVEKSVNAPKKVAQQAPTKPAVEKKEIKEKQPDVKQPDVVETPKQNQKPDPGKKTATEKKVVKKGTKPPTPIPQVSTSSKSTSKPSTTSASSAATAVSQYQAKTQGHVEVFKSADFKSAVSSLVAKGGSLAGVKTKSQSGAGGSLTGAASGVSSGTGNIKTADIATDQGSLTGSTTAKLGESKGAEGLSAKKAIYTAGIPSTTVVLGSMDPDTIRRILIDHLPQFRHCYQKELERAGAEISDVVKLNFVIGASGHVSKASAEGGSSLPAVAKRCVVGVLQGIVFPEPMGGGTVEVSQPMNFYPNKR